MTRLERSINLIAVTLPFAAFAVAVALLWNRAVGPLDLVLLAVLYVVIALGVTVGYHRLLTHAAFGSPPPVRYALAVLGSMAVQGPVIDWVADHRKHHAHTDEEGDPHSPHGHGSGFAGMVRGLLYAHMGWLLDTQGQARKRKYAPDLLEDRGMRAINRLFVPLALLGLLVPFALGWAIGGDLRDGLTGLLWGGLVRVFLLHHVTWSINSVCHFFGRRRFATDDHSTNVAWLALPSLGEAWHHNHHAFPRSSRHGLRRLELDPSAMVITAMERLGLARNVIRISPERQQARLATEPESAEAAQTA
ncbi:MAG: fatty acid desaturase [Thermoleophilaceae bacterium]|jgi:stearoyl-CoA desaturase (delta-9 desaturase)|nr:fatty acid desaturase [Thermoleophilaceae bacterium]MDQ3320238.1 fatty acid desaturase [Actinomycetota bacterium]